MAYERAVAAAFARDDAARARHANPWSVWTRILTLPVLVLAVWTRAWLGWWALAPVAATVLWIWLNPRLFPRPRRRTTRSPCGRLFRVPRLVKLNSAVAGHLEVSDQAVTHVGDRVGELDASRLQLGNRFLNIIAVERDIVSARRRAF